MIKAVVTDIEGTTSSLSFVKDILFPYARQHLPTFVRQHQAEDEVIDLLNAARQIARQDLALEPLIDQFIAWIDQDQKITPLKSIQGLIWEDGYRQGAFKGHVYEDAVRRLRAWKQQGLDLYVYSSGSVYAQKLLFAHTEFGDLTPLFSGYFDTTIGGKKQPEAYRAIARQIQCQTEQILFLSDIESELDAAKAAGFQTYWLVREQVIEAEASHRQSTDFDSISL